MDKQKRPILLFIICLFTLVALQSYYLYNSYKLEEKELNREARILVNKVIQKMERINEANEDSVIRNFKFLSNFQSSSNKKSEQLKQQYIRKKFITQKVDSILSIIAANTPFNIAIQSEVYSVYDKANRKELINKKQPIVLFKTKQSIKNGIEFSDGKWESEQKELDTNKKVDIKYFYLIRSRNTFELLNIKALILKKIIPLIAVNLLILLLIIYIFLKSLKNLKTQEQKIAQLHTTIDSIAHELNTPLTTLKFTLASSPNNEIKTVIERQVTRIETVVSSIHYQNSPSTLLTQKVAENYLADIKKRFGNLAIETEFLFNFNNHLLFNDFEIIINNLIENSSKYKAKQVKLKVKFDNKIEISITDDGIGIPETEHKHIFEKYYRISRAENMQINGLGIGLHLVKQMVDKYAGHIKVKSEPSQGVTFKITLPNEN